MRVAEPATVKENQICDGKTDIIGCHPNRDLSFDWSRPTLIPELFLQWQNLWRGSLGMMMGSCNMAEHGFPWCEPCRNWDTGKCGIHCPSTSVAPSQHKHHPDLKHHPKEISKESLGPTTSHKSQKIIRWVLLPKRCGRAKNNSWPGVMFNVSKTQRP